jgi:hypothetical protein
MSTLLLLGGSVVAVLLFVWGARKLYERFPHRLSLDGEDYTRRSDGSFTNALGARIADPRQIARLEAEWQVVSHAYNAAQRLRQQRLEAELAADGTERSPASVRVPVDPGMPPIPEETGRWATVWNWVKGIALLLFLAISALLFVLDWIAG